MKLSGFPEGHVGFTHSLLKVFLALLYAWPVFFSYVSLLSYKEQEAFIHPVFLRTSIREVKMASAMRPASDDEMNYPKNEKIAGEEPEVVADGYSVREGEDILALQDIDPALNAKMHLVNNVK
jgi:hypothetical protein